MTYISRDPFARQELHRESVVVGAEKTCDWCGNKKRRTLFWYYIEPDRVNYRRDDIKGLFCGIGCMRDYHNIQNGR